jgi:hypothetical protein|tara:strand:+ start:439 stop:606 length:168 start_codon:yes stop_codon:yes gene_type:complete
MVGHNIKFDHCSEFYNYGCNITLVWLQATYFKHTLGKGEVHLGRQVFNLKRLYKI